MKTKTILIITAIIFVIGMIIYFVFGNKNKIYDLMTALNSSIKNDTVTAELLNKINDLSKYRLLEAALFYESNFKKDFYNEIYYIKLNTASRLEILEKLRDLNLD